MAIKGSRLYVPMNYAVKIPTKDRDYFLMIDLSQDIERLQVVKERTSTPQFDHRRSGTQIQTRLFLELKLRHPIAQEIQEKHAHVLSAQGFQGSPVYIENDTIQFHFDFVMGSAAKIRRMFAKKGLFDGKLTKRIINFDPQMSKEEIFSTSRRIRNLGDSIFLNKFFEYLVQTNSLTQSEKQKILNELKGRE